MRGILRGLVGAAAVASTFGLTAVTGDAAAVAAPSLQPLTFTAGVQSVTSTTHKHLKIAIVAQSLSVPTPAQRAEGVTVTLTRNGVPESHSWAFALTNPNDFSWDTTTDTGVLSTGTSLKAYGSLSLKLVASGHEVKVGCGRTRADDHPVTVNGTVVFHTRSKGAQSWGTVDRTRSFSFTGHSVLAILDPSDALCGSGLPPCNITKVWQAFTALPQSGFVQLRGSATAISGTRVIHLSSPAHAVRTDNTTRAIRHTEFTFPGNSARTRVLASGGNLTGSATLTSTSENSMPALACGVHQLSADTQWGATYKNGTKPLVLHEQVGGNMTVRNNTVATIDRIVAA